jgi:hypothetical protein
MNLRWAEGRELRILDFDCECRPLSYAGPDWTTAEVTAIAAGWIGGKRIKCWALGQVDMDEMLLGFCRLYDQADMVTGHYIKRFDLPLLNGALLERKLPLLGPKLVCDTRTDLFKKKDFSASQESLGLMYGLSHPKEHMSQPQWREANRLTPEGIKETRRRVMGDVRHHMALRQALIDAGALHSPKVWYP